MNHGLYQLIVELEDTFPDKLPSLKEHLSHPEDVLRRIGNQEVIRYLKSKLEAA